VLQLVLWRGPAIGKTAPPRWGFLRSVRKGSTPSMQKALRGLMGAGDLPWSFTPPQSGACFPGTGLRARPGQLGKRQLGTQASVNGFRQNDDGPESGVL